MTTYSCSMTPERQRIVQRAYEAFHADVDATPRITLRGGDALDSYDEPPPYDPAVDAPNDAYLEAWAFNGLAFNGMSWNGLAYNGLVFNGMAFNGMTYNGITWNGITDVLVNGLPSSYTFSSGSGLDYTQPFASPAAVPEPGPFLTALGGMVLLGWRVRSRRSAD